MQRKTQKGEMNGMNVDYNPQAGYRRTTFSKDYDFLLRISELTEDGCAVVFLVETVRGSRAEVKISFLQQDVFRLQMCPADESPGGNPVFDFAPGIKAQLLEREAFFEYKTDRMSLHFRKEFWEMSVYYEGRMLTKEQVFDTNVDNRCKYLPIGLKRDEKGRWIECRETMYLYADESFWGFGEKFTNFNKRGQMIHCWQKDALSTNTEDSYKNHPFFISSRGYAILLNTYTRSKFDMGCTSQAGYGMSSEDGFLDYVFLAARQDDYKALLENYVRLTGEIPMIPKWAFGFWMSKCSYQNRQEVEEVVKRAEKERIRLDVIHIDNWQKPGYTGLWEWDTERFPDPAGMIRWLSDKNIHLSLWNYPYLEENSPEFEKLADRNYFVKDLKGRPAMFYATADSEVRAACFDFSNPEFIAWYEKRIADVLQMGISVIKTDFSEAVPEEVVFYDGLRGIEGHNRLTYLYARTVYGIMREAGKKTGNLPLIWCRSGFAGSHRIPAAWAGDSSCALNNHASVLRGGLSLALSGVAYWGFDMGGFYSTGADGNECPPTPEEYLRSVEMGFFMPLSRAHGKTPREPWNFPDPVTDIVRKYNEIRHRMVPYLYHTACEAHLQSVPMLRPLLLEFPGDWTARGQDLTYMLGGSLLVAPPFDRTAYPVYLPEGIWLEMETGEIVEGGKYRWLQPALENLPVFLRSDSVLPVLAKESDSSVSQEPFPQLEVMLLFEKEVRQIYYDSDEKDGISSRSFYAFKKKEENCLYIETDMNIACVKLFTTEQIDSIFMNGSALSDREVIICRKSQLKI